MNAHEDQADNAQEHDQAVVKAPRDDRANHGNSTLAQSSPWSRGMGIPRLRVLGFNHVRRPGTATVGCRIANADATYTKLETLMRRGSGKASRKTLATQNFRSIPI
jgi:hypothetical protein